MYIINFNMILDNILLLIWEIKLYYVYISENSLRIWCYDNVNRNEGYNNRWIWFLRWKDSKYYNELDVWLRYTNFIIDVRDWYKVPLWENKVRNFAMLQYLDHKHAKMKIYFFLCKFFYNKLYSNFIIYLSLEENITIFNTFYICL